MSSEKTLNPLGAETLGAPLELEDELLEDDRDDELDFEDELDFDEEDDDDELPLAEAFFLLPPLVAKNTMAPMMTTAATTIAMIGPVPSPDFAGAPMGTGAPGGPPIGGPPTGGPPIGGPAIGAPNGCVGCAGGKGAGGTGAVGGTGGTGAVGAPASVAA